MGLEGNSLRGEKKGRPRPTRRERKRKRKRRKRKRRRRHQQPPSPTRPGIAYAVRGDQPPSLWFIVICLHSHWYSHLSSHHNSRALSSEFGALSYDFWALSWQAKPCQPLNLCSMITFVCGLTSIKLVNLSWDPAQTYSGSSTFDKLKLVKLVPPQILYV